MYEIPILILSFIRPICTKQIIENVRKIKPKKLYFAVDGPRDANDVEKCAEVRKCIELVDWNCEVHTKFQSTNLGCRLGVTSAITWFFENEEMGVILEDDTLPSTDFYPYMEAMLNRYKDDPRIFMVSGDNFQFGVRRGNADYYYSAYAHIWGWGTWRRTWQNYDVTLGNLDNHFQNKLPLHDCCSDEEATFWYKKFLSTKAGKFDTWDYQLMFTGFSQGVLSVMPNVNLVSNIGYDMEGSTHAKGKGFTSDLPTRELKTYIQPDQVRQSVEADKFTYSFIFRAELIRISTIEHILLTLNREKRFKEAIQLVSQALNANPNSKPFQALYQKFYTEELSLIQIPELSTT